MAWYRAGTAAVTNGSATVTGTGTAWVNNVQIGHAINLPDGRVYEVLSVDSNTLITLGSPYLGGTGSGQPYSVQPNQGFAQTAATALTNFLTQINQWVSGALAGRFGDGSPAAPGMSFASDQDTGFARSGENVVSIVTGGVVRATFDATGATSIGYRLNLSSPQGTASGIQFGQAGTANWLFQNVASANAMALIDNQFGAERFRVDGSGNFLIGVSSGSNHVISRAAGVSTSIAAIASSTTGFDSARFIAPDAHGYSTASAAVWLGKINGTNRSLNAGGTINASGADYAEYMRKADGCGTIGKGDVCGVDVDGNLTKTWSAAISFAVKSTDPSLVGGDTWTAHMPPHPEQEEDEAEEAFQARLDAWNVDLQAARLCVDRIAFCGQVPCNVTGDFSVGDYVVAAASGAGIKAVAVKAADITLAQYMRRIGKVWAIRDGRGWIDVQHG